MVDVDFPLPTGAPDSANNPAEVSCDYMPGTNFSIGVTDVTCTAEDAATGLNSTCSFKVKVGEKPQEAETLIPYDWLGVFVVL